LRYGSQKFIHLLTIPAILTPRINKLLTEIDEKIAQLPIAMQIAGDGDQGAPVRTANQNRSMVRKGDNVEK